MWRLLSWVDRIVVEEWKTFGRYCNGAENARCDADGLGHCNYCIFVKCHLIANLTSVKFFLARGMSSEVLIPGPEGSKRPRGLQSRAAPSY